MNDTCATHRSRVPRRSFGRIKRRSDDIGRRERTRPGFYFMFCVRAVGVCGEGGVVQRSLQREKDSGDSGK